LDPEVIPIICIKVAEKGSDGQIGLINLLDYRSPATQKRSAIQPLLDALQIRPFILDLQGFKTTVITEGIYDYFALEMFKGTRAISVLPSVGAESIRYFVSLMIAWHIAFRALWDNDTEGKEQFSRAAKLFGEEITGRCLRLLPSKDEKKKILQDLFHGQDLVNVRKELGLPENCSFEHTVHSLYYSSKRPELLSNFSHTTLQNFNELFVALSVD
jgi:hypothetical protein